MRSKAETKNEFELSPHNNRLHSDGWALAIWVSFVHLSEFFLLSTIRLLNPAAGEAPVIFKLSTA